MTIELTILAWTLILALIYILTPTMLRNRETGLAYNAGNRDAEAPPMGVVTGRLMRAKQNLFETLPLFIAAVLIAGLANVHTAMTVWGCWLFLGARIVYLPIYGFGVPYVRTAVWLVSLVGLLMIVIAVLKG
jgi:uncharacterized MAPEG superfamily protein